MSKPHWDVLSADTRSLCEGSVLLSDGWEPFAVNAGLVWFKRVKVDKRISDEFAERIAAAIFEWIHCVPFEAALPEAKQRYLSQARYIIERERLRPAIDVPA